MAESNGKAHHYKSRFYSFEQYVEVYHILNHLQDYFDEHLQKPNRVPKICVMTRNAISARSRKKKVTPLAT